MSKYLLLYRTPTSARDRMAEASPEEAQAGMDAWMAWAARAGDGIVDLGSPLAPATTVGAVTPGDALLGGFSVVEADGVDALRALLEGHPHLMMDGAGIEAHELLPLPGG